MGIGFFVFSVSLVLFSTLFPGGAAEIDSFGSADPPGLRLPCRPISERIGLGEGFPVILVNVWGSLRVVLDFFLSFLLNISVSRPSKGSPFPSK